MENSRMNDRAPAKAASVSAAPSAQKVTPPRNPAAASAAFKYTNPSLTVEKSIVNELLLVCGVIGSTVDPKTQQMIPVEDCINWLQDLQRALRRDEDAFRPISLLLGQWKIVEQKLLPLVLSCRYNTPLVLTIVKILVILTKPLSANAKNAAGLIIDTRRGKTNPAVIEEQIHLRDNAIAQMNLLTEYKKLFVHHPSHLRNKKSKSNGSKKEVEGLLSVFVSLLAEPLSKTGMARTTEDHLTMELVLHLLRNLLCAGDPILKDVEKVQSSTILHQELVALFEREMVLDFFLVVGQELENRENKQYNLLMMEILHHMLKKQDPAIVARSASRKSDNVKKNKSGLTTRNVKSQGNVPSRAGSLMSRLKKEKQSMQSASNGRHSNFAGIIVSQKAGGQQKVRSAASAQKSSSSRRGFQAAKTNIVEKRKTKKHQYFIGSGRSQAIHAREGVVNSNPTQMSGSLASRRSQRVLHYFCISFMTQCYGPVMKSLKNEFRRDSSRLENEDKVIFFRLIYFFSQWWRVATEEGVLTKMILTSDNSNGDGAGNKSIRHLIFTMDMFTFNLVLTTADSFLEHKKYKNLALAVSLYVEMMKLLSIMYNSSDSTENLMAMGLMDRLFYQSENIDRLPKLLSAWIPGTFSREYVCDILDLTHVTLRLLERNEKACKAYGISERATSKKDLETKDNVVRMKSVAAEFGVANYVARKIISNHSVFLFTQLLSQYNVNSVEINDRIVSFFVRLCKFVVASEQGDESEVEKKEDVTLEPMLFNLPLLAVLNEILNDSNIAGDQSFDTILRFSSTVVRHYARASERNPLLHVEALFCHNLPHNFCELSSDLYVPEELKMIVERDMLIEQSREDDDSVEEETCPKIVDAEEELVFLAHDVSGRRQSKDAKENVEYDNGSDSNVETSLEDKKEIKVTSNLVQEKIVNDSKLEREIEAEEDRWNDRRTFVRRRKFGDQEADDKGDARGSQNPSLSDPKRIRRTVLLDSDDEDFGDDLNVSSNMASARMLLEDSDED